ncbi:MAG: tetratricopeptide repeat protein [Polyangiales bacterium]
MADARAEVAALWRDGRYAEAFAALDAALRAEPARAELHADAAGMRAEMFDPERCRVHARRARELAPTDCSLALRVASALKGLGLLPEAVGVVVESLATQADPTPALLRDAAALLFDAGDYARAEALLEGRLAVEPGAPEALRALAEVALWRGELSLAEARAASILEAGVDVVARTTLGAARAFAGTTPAPSTSSTARCPSRRATPRRRCGAPTRCAARAGSTTLSPRRAGAESAPPTSPTTWPRSW